MAGAGHTEQRRTALGSLTADARGEEPHQQQRRTDSVRTYSTTEPHEKTAHAAVIPNCVTSRCATLSSSVVQATYTRQTRAVLKAATRQSRAQPRK